MKRSSQRALDEAKKRNFIERLKFIDSYADWIKKTPNKVWSKQLAKMLDG